MGGLKLVVETVELVTVETVLDGRYGLIREVNDKALQHHLDDVDLEARLV